MIIRQYTDGDLDAIKDMHKKADLGYNLPPMSEFFSKRLVEDSTGVGMAVLLKLTAEAYLLCNPEWRTPAWRLEAIRQLQLESYDDAKAKGVKESFAFIPPPIERRFHNRLKQLGWLKAVPMWNCYSKDIL